MNKNFILKFFLVIIFLTSFLLLIFSGLSDSQTTDEAIHLFSGYTYLTQKDFRLDPEHPPLLKELAATPLLFFQSLKISLGNFWIQAGNFYYDSWQEARVLGEEFFYSLGNSPAKLLFWGRLPFIFLTLILGYFGYFWAKKIYGEKPGILASFLILFFPNILAHGRLINTDLGLTLFIFIATYFWGQFLKQKNCQNLFLTGLFSGLAMASKYTAIILFIILFVLAVIKLFQEKEKYGKIILGYLGVLIISFIVVWASYGFSLHFMAEFYKGIFFVLRHTLGGHGSFLLGQNSNFGWWYYFPVTIFYKTPIPIFILLILTIIMFTKIRAKNIFDEYLLIIPPIIFLILAMISKADLGIRHILPIFPFLFVFIAKSINLIDFRKIKLATIA
ncbi:MAG: glycosyltransferase family 39 protein, partial [Patescibacteria group bacterium]|nr:glycosyltransferase family 39 protein [Patescibacteria group bacterium]